jgi:hypothetical protein
MLLRSLRGNSDFVDQLVHFEQGFIHCRAPGFGQRVHLADLACHHFLAGEQEAIPLQSVQDGVERAGTQQVAVPRQFSNHIQPKDRLLPGVMQQVQANEAGEKVAGYGIVFRYRYAIRIRRDLLVVKIKKQFPEEAFGELGPQPR